MMNKHSLGFWGKLERPFCVLAPMADVTDAAFRQVVAECGKPDVTYTEFVSADGLCSAGRPTLLPDLQYSEIERPVVAQLFTAHPDKIFAAAQLVRKLGFDGLDLNMGCPDRSVEKQGAGAALIKKPALAKELIAAAQQGAHPLPVSVKTRLGYATLITEEWVETLVSTGIAALVLHLRTRREMSKVPAHWDEATKAVAVRDRMGAATLIVGNGDVATPKEAEEKAAETGVDGVMLGRGIFGNPWLFNRIVARDTLPVADRLAVLVRHTELFEKYFAGKKHFAIMRKHFSSYLAGIREHQELKAALMAAENAQAVADSVRRFLEKTSALPEHSLGRVPPFSQRAGEKE